MPSCDDWLVQVPLGQLMELQNSLKVQKKLQDDNNQLRRELDGLRGILSQTMELLADMRRA